MVTSHSESLNYGCTLVIYLSLMQGVCRGVYVGSRDLHMEGRQFARVGWTHCHSYRLKKDSKNVCIYQAQCLCSTMHAIFHSIQVVVISASYYVRHESHDSASTTHTHTHSYHSHRPQPLEAPHRKDAWSWKSVVLKITSKVSMLGFRSTIKSYIIVNPAREILNTFILVFLQELK